MSATATAPVQTGFTTDTPQHKQAIFMTCPADEVEYGGAAGGAKSNAIVNDAISKCLRDERSSKLVLRRETREYRQLVQEARRILDPYPDVARWVSGERWFEFYNGSKLAFGHAANESDIEKYGGDAYDTVYLDEETYFTQYQRDYIRTRIRSASGYWTRIKGATNPVGVSFMEVKNYYVTPPDRNVEIVAWFDEEAALADNASVYDYANYWRWYPEGTRGNPTDYMVLNQDGVPDQERFTIIVWRPEPTPFMHRRNAQRAERGLPPLKMPTRCFIPSFLEDNKYLYDDGQYETRLAASQGAALAERLLSGSWKFFEGQAFPEWNDAVHVIPPISIPEAWSHNIWGGKDWGWAKPGCHLWAVQRPETGQVIVYREVYEDHWHDTQWSDEIKRKTLHPEKLRFSLADPSMWRGDSNDEGLSKAEIYRRNGVILEPGNNDRIAGWGRIRELLAINPLTGEPGLVVTSNCVNLIRTLPALALDKHRPEDVDTESEDHAADALRYLLMARTTQQRNRTKRIAAGRIRR